jgi:hypothetical protein
VAYTGPKYIVTAVKRIEDVLFELFIADYGHIAFKVVVVADRVEVM